MAVARADDPDVRVPPAASLIHPSAGAVFTKASSTCTIRRPTIRPAAFVPAMMPLAMLFGLGQI